MGDRSSVAVSSVDNRRSVNSKIAIGAGDMVTLAKKERTKLLKCLQESISHILSFTRLSILISIVL